MFIATGLQKGKCQFPYRVPEDFVDEESFLGGEDFFNCHSCHRAGRT
jgi:hypothetical protein